MGRTSFLRIGSRPLTVRGRKGIASAKVLVRVPEPLGGERAHSDRDPPRLRSLRAESAHPGVDAAMMASPITPRVFLAPGRTDMRKAINGLSVLVEGHLELDPFSGHWFVFCNRARTIIKILYWGATDFVFGRSVWRRSAFTQDPGHSPHPHQVCVQKLRGNRKRRAGGAWPHYARQQCRGKCHSHLRRRQEEPALHGSPQWGSRRRHLIHSDRNGQGLRA
ncbi:IS66 family insertion sequence element accessory protein TnpB [Desulfoglaeba alkanexedens ALDC]|uniref:IS66 family insertion sequence element accessory protein TnpB n=1 Tax=Desulfoglaeba alkanexedens ALDC TaxID=980445 RepID=A0A4P8L2M9_9BACT|nr:IS66 family insertion sequence element accessory protein TnpB [Desulfoglaeba alkanexedens ALDC]